jgi:thiamine-phosphate pyrophosphorylase
MVVTGVIIPRLYAIVDAETLARKSISVRAFARELREAGVRLLQYRDKTGGPQKVLRGAEEVAAAFAGVDAVLVMNDRADLAALMGWGVHVGQGDLPLDAARAVLLSHPRAEDAREWGTQIVGISTHDAEQVRAADAALASCEPTSHTSAGSGRDVGHPGLLVADYVAVGPVFGTSTKLDAEPVVGLEGVRRARALTAKPLVAIGGITLENCVSVVEAGADSVAVIGGMFVAGRSVGDVARDFLARLR